MKDSNLLGMASEDFHDEDLLQSFQDDNLLDPNLLLLNSNSNSNMMADDDLLDSNIEEDMLDSKCSVVNMLDDPMNDDDLELRFNHAQSVNER